MTYSKELRVVASEAIVIPLDYPKGPPLRSNKRLHWRAEHRLKADIRQASRLTARSWMNRHPGAYPLPYRVDVLLVWSVPTRHVRDSDSPQPTLKSWQDGAVDAGLLSGDDFTRVRRSHCEIEHTPGQPMSMRIEITEVTE